MFWMETRTERSLLAVLVLLECSLVCEILFNVLALDAPKRAKIPSQSTEVRCQVFSGAAAPTGHICLGTNDVKSLRGHVPKISETTGS